MQILIVSPPWQHSSGGVRCLHYFGYLAHKLGHNVSMLFPQSNPDWGDYNGTVLKPDLLILPEIADPSCWAIKTIRWVLYYPGVLNPKVPCFPDHEQVYYYLPEFAEASKTAANGREVKEFFLPNMFLPGLDKKVSRDLAGAFWLGKGKKVEAPEIEGLPEITRTFPASHKDLVLFLKRCKRIYSFDNCTAVNQEAQLCGCEVFVWNGEKFEPFYDPAARRQLANESKDLYTVKKFLKSI